MNSETDNKIVWHYGVNFVVACLLFVALVAVVRFSVSVPAVNADRAAVRARALADIRAAETTALTAPGWINQDRNIVRLPIDTALQLAVKAAQNPAAARADLIARAQKATAPALKSAPKPSAFE
jgi:hypothetical protein